MRVLEQTRDRLVLESPPIRVLLVLAVIFACASLGFLNAAAATTTLTCDRAKGLCRLVEHDLLGDAVVTIPAAKLGRAEVVTYTTKKGATNYRVRLNTGDGEQWLSQYSDSDQDKHTALAARVNAFSEGQADRLEEKTHASWSMGAVSALFAGVTAFMLYLGTRRWRTTLDRQIRLVTFTRTSVFGKKTEEWQFAQVRGVDLDVRGGKTVAYFIRLRLLSEEMRHLGQDKAGRAHAEALVEQLNAFLGDRELAV